MPKGNRGGKRNNERNVSDETLRKYLENEVFEAIKEYQNNKLTKSEIKSYGGILRAIIDHVGKIYEEQEKIDKNIGIQESDTAIKHHKKEINTMQKDVIKRRKRGKRKRK